MTGSPPSGAFDIEAADALARLGPGFRTATVESLPSGDSSAVFLVLGAGGEQVVVKMYGPQSAWKVDKEVFLYGLLGDHLKGRIPRVLFADRSQKTVRWSCLVMTRVKGELLMKIQAQLDDGELLAIWHQVGGLLRRLHEVRFEAFSYLGAGGCCDRRRQTSNTCAAGSTTSYAPSRRSAGRRSSALLSSATLTSARS